MHEEILYFFDKWKLIFAIFCVVILSIAYIRVAYLDALAKEQNKERKKAENPATRRTLEREAEFLLNKGTFVKNISDALEKEYQKDIFRKVERTRSEYKSENYRDFCKTFLIDYKQICYNEPSNDRVLGFNIAGYYNLDALGVNPAALAVALCKYSDKWQGARSEYREDLLGYYDVGCFEANEEYWNEYFQKQFDIYYKNWNVRPLKQI